MSVDKDQVISECINYEFPAYLKKKSLQGEAVAVRNMMVDCNKTISVGFWISDGKWKRLQLDKIEAKPTEVDGEKTTVIPIKINKLTDVLKCDIVVSKRKNVDNDPEDIVISKQLELYPSIIELDERKDQKVIFNRRDTFQNLNLVASDLKPVLVMPSFTLTSSRELDELLDLTDDTSKFPFICKPNILRGNDSDHHMKIVYKKEDFTDLNFEEYLFQPMVKHKGLLKVFVIGEVFYVAVRPSVNSFMDEKQCKMFVTSEWKSLKPNDIDLNMYLRDSVSDETIRNLMHVMAIHFKLSLYGVDLIIAEDDSPFIIDVNVFPGYSEMIQNRGIDYVHDAILSLALQKFKSIGT